MPFNRQALRLERFQIEVVYHSAYSFWNLRGVLAERWAHGPIFGGTNEGPQQITLMPLVDNALDPQLQAVYGLKASGVIAEGEERVREAREIGPKFICEALEVLKPKRVVRVGVNLFALYPVSNIQQASRKLRGAYYRNDPLEQVLPESVRAERDRFHSAIDFIVPKDNGVGLSVVVGAVGPPHTGVFLQVPDPKRDSQWWMGFRLERRQVDEEGIDDTERVMTTVLTTAEADYEHVVSAVLGTIL